MKRSSLAGLMLAAGAAAQTETDWHGVPVVPGELLVSFREGTTQQVQDARHEALGADRLATLSPTLAHVALPAAADLDAFVARYAAVAEVLWAQPNVLHRPVATSDTYWSSQWALQTVRAAEAWEMQSGEPDAVVAVIDSGVDSQHPDLAAHLAWAADPYGGDNDPEDTNGHGSHCCGVAAAVTDNGLGVAGAAPGARFAAYRCGGSSFPTSALVAAIDDAVARGALVLSLSWGSSYQDAAIQAALQDAHEQGCLVVAAAGNDATTTKFWPAAHDFVLAVAATQSNDALASFSNHGAWVDVAAPGQSILSTFKNGGYATLSGTSMACPLVAGLGVLLYAALGGERSVETAALVRAALETGCVDTGVDVAHGRIDFVAALQALLPEAPAVLASIAPDEVQALGGGLVSLTGTGLAGASQVLVDQTSAGGLVVTGDTLLVFEAPPAPELGLRDVVVISPAGTSAPLSLTFVETDPPLVLAPATTSAGDSFTWQLGGRAEAWYALLVAVDDATLPFHGGQMLGACLVLTTGALDERGLFDLSVTMPAGFDGLTFFSQLVTRDEQGFALSPVAATTISA